MNISIPWGCTCPSLLWHLSLCGIVKEWVIDEENELVLIVYGEEPLSVQQEVEHGGMLQI